MQIEFAERVLREFEYFAKYQTKTLRKIQALLQDMQRSPYTGLGKPEALKHEFSGCWSRRISDEHRLVYRVDGKRIIILQCRFHYDNR
ncbi:MAG: Txe/YoeB family addiction module toxin [Alphaproteobacteria bacterium]